MNQLACFRNAVAALFLGSSIMLGSSALAAETGPNIFPGYTTPSQNRGLNFNSPGVVSKVYVKEGDVVKNGQLLAEQDARVEEAELKVLEVDANSDLQVDAAKKEKIYKQLEVDQKQKELDQKVTSRFEFMEKKLDFDVAAARYDLALQTKLQDGLKAEKTRQMIAQKKLYSTTDGIVQQINVHEGELSSNDPKTPVVSVVTIDKLFVEVDLPIPDAKPLKVHQKILVQYEDDSKWRTAGIVLIYPVANAMAHTQKVRLELDNTENLSAGLGVQVKLGEKVAAAK